MSDSRQTCIVSKYISSCRPSLCVSIFMCAAPPGKKAVLASSRCISIIRVALLPAEWLPTLTVPFVGGRDVDVAFTQPLARTQTRAGLPEQARVILRGRRRCASYCKASYTDSSASTRRLHIIKWEFHAFSQVNS